jgi:hypothetical protein
MLPPGGVPTITINGLLVFPKKLPPKPQPGALTSSLFIMPFDDSSYMNDSVPPKEPPAAFKIERWPPPKPSLIVI